MEGPSGLSLLVVVVVLLLLFLPYASVVLLALPAPVIYIAAALIPSALLLSGCNAQQASAAGSQDHEHDVSIAADHSPVQQQASDATADAANSSTSTQAHGTGVSRCGLHKARQGLLGVQDPAAQPQTCAAPAALQSGMLGQAGTVHCSAVTGPPCAGNCSSSSCPWHLPMAPSLRLWGQDSITDCSSNSRRKSGGGKRPSSTNYLQAGPGLQEQPGAGDAFSFSLSSSTAHARGNSPVLPAAAGLFRSFSAPAAQEVIHKAADVHSPLALDKSAVDGAAAQQHWAPLPDSMAAVHCEPGVVELSLQFQQQPQSAQQPFTSTAPDSPGPFWVSCGASAAAAAPAAHRDAQQQVQAAAQQASAPVHSTAAADDAGQDLDQAPVAATDAEESLHVQACSYLQPVQQDCQQHERGEDPCTPVAAARQSEMLALLDCTWAGTQHHLQAPEQQQQLTHSPYTPQDQQQQLGRYAGGSVTPLPFIATTARHGMCMRHPSSRHHHAGGSPLSLSSGGVAAWAQPLPSPAESPLARRLSDRNDFGLPAASPALTELLSSGGSSRRQLRRDLLSLDTCRRSVSSPGSNCSSVELQQQELEQGVPWAGMQLRSVAHLLQQRVQEVVQQQPGDSEAGSTPWYRRYQLERRHTTCNALDLSAAVDRAVAAVDAAVVEEHRASEMADGPAAASGSMPPFQRHHRRSSSESSNCSGLETDTSPVSVTVLPSGPLHRLACCSSAAKKQPVDAAAGGGRTTTCDAGVAADAATAAIVCGSVEAGHNSCGPPMGDVSPWSQNGPRSHSIW